MCGWVHGNLPTRIMHLDVCHSLLACMYAIECPFRPFSSILPAYAGGSPHGLLLASWLVGSPLGVYLAHPPQVTSGSWITDISFPQGIWVGSVQHPPLESYSPPKSTGSVTSCYRLPLRSSVSIFATRILSSCSPAWQLRLHAASPPGAL